jgi:hypothetical protein
VENPADGSGNCSSSNQKATAGSATGRTVEVCQGRTTSPLLPPDAQYIGWTLVADSVIAADV